MAPVTRDRPVTDIVLALAGPIAWATHFMLLYFAQSWICATASRPQLAFTVAAWLLTAFVFGGLIIALFALRNRTTANDGSVFLHRTGLALGLLSAVAICWTMFPTAMLPACPA